MVRCFFSNQEHLIHKDGLFIVTNGCAVTLAADGFARNVISQSGGAGGMQGGPKQHHLNHGALFDEASPAVGVFGMRGGGRIRTARLVFVNGLRLVQRVCVCVTDRERRMNQPITSGKDFK